MSCCPNCGQELRTGPTRYWTHERVIQALQEWAGEHGRPPTIMEWGTSSYSHPSQKTVRERFGTWNQAIAAAGFVPRPWRRRKAVS